MNDKRFSDRALPAKVLILALIAVSLLIVATAERDLQRRPDEEVRGSRTLWRLLSLNALGAGAYLRFGRRT